ncbi:hypothetical protein AKJ16_DCAP07607 [Drosera capensis]
MISCWDSSVACRRTPEPSVVHVDFLRASIKLVMVSSECCFELRQDIPGKTGMDSFEVLHLVLGYGRETIMPMPVFSKLPLI